MQIDKLLPHLVCPETKENVFMENNSLRTRSGKIYGLTKEGKPDFIGSEKNMELTSKRDVLDRIKALAKKMLGGAYVNLVYIISPVMPRIHWGTFQSYWAYISKKYSKGNKVVIQIGSGNDRISDEIINIDIFDFPGADVIADCAKLPFKDNSVDGVISIAVLEHVPNPEVFIKEANRVLKKDGFIITGVPFLQGFHASPSDYYRWTHKGLNAWHEQNGFKKEKILANSGPTSSFLWITQEWLSIILSFGLNPLYYFWWTLFLIAFFPFKVLDLLFIYYPQAYKINSFNIYIGKKA